MSTFPAVPTPEPPAAPGSAQPPYRAEVLKEDLCSRVERIACGGDTIVRKTYRPAAFFLWRTFLAKAKAAREFTNLTALRRAGVPAVEPLGWSEDRVLGTVPRCTLDLADMGAVPDLREVFADPALAPGRRRAAVTAFGQLLRRLHDRGFVSLTFYPRNVLLADPDSALPRATLCDQPYLLAAPRPLRGSALASLDVYDALFTSSRRTSLTRTERLRALCAYADGDRALARRLWRRLQRRPLWLQRARKGWCKILATVLSRRP